MPVKLIAKVASHHLADSPIFVILFCLVVTSAALIITIGPMAAQQMWLSLQNVQIGINGISVDADLIVKNNNQKVVTLEEITLYFTENNEIHALEVSVYGATLPSELKPYQELDLGLNGLADRPLMEGIEAEAWVICNIEGQAIESRHTLFTM